MQNSATDIDCVKQKLPKCKKVTVSIRRKSDNSVKILKGLSLKQILRELVVNQKNDFSTKINSDGNLNRPKNIVFNRPIINDVKDVKANSRLPSDSCKNKREITKIRVRHVFSKNGRRLVFPGQFFAVNESNGAFKRSWNMTVNNKKEGTQSEHHQDAGVDSSPCRVRKKKRKFNQITSGNKFSNIIQEPINDLSKVVKESDSSICVIKEVIGNAVTAFSGSDGNNDNICSDSDVICLDSKEEAQLIVPKKTDDITKIKGWRRKQFFVEKPTTVEFQEFSYDSSSFNETNEEDPLSDSPAENAFVCKSLDEFLEQDANLKINYEVPHLVAEVGIKLTKEEVVSTPKITNIEEVENKYCMSVPSFNDINLCDTSNKKLKRGKHDGNNSEGTYKIVKLENNSIRLVRLVKNSTNTDKETNNSGKSPPVTKCETKEDTEKSEGSHSADDDGIKLTSKVLGLVVYPSPDKPLHPVVQFHLRKLRSYRTTIDPNWANFAASAVKCENSKSKRCIIPVTCCVKVLNDPVSVKKKITSVSAPVISPAEEAETVGDQRSQEIFSVEELKRMKSCRVVISKLDIGPGNKSWCAEHSRLNCRNCDFRISEPKSRQCARKKTWKRKIDRPREDEKQLPAPPRPVLYEDVINLLEKKLKIFHPDSLTSIDSLKTLNVNAVELIKVKFIQKSFWHDYIRIWYLEQEEEEEEAKARAFLTFSKTPPVPNAINLRCGRAVNNLPKVMREIIYAEKCVDPNEYVLLYCNGNYWEIHGSVNVAFNKYLKGAERVLVPAELPELKKLQSISLTILPAKGFKWWVLDLTQKFQIIEIKTEHLVASISQRKLWEFIKHYTCGFLPLRKNSGGRTFGAYITKTLLPYALIGPYYLTELHNVSLRGPFSDLPFAYSEATDSNESKLLKFYISTTIKETKKSGKAVEGLWLHYRALLGESCYLEVMATSQVNWAQRTNYNVHEEHGYSLNSTSAPEVNLGSGSNLQAEVYLYFDIFGLGYVLGALEEDNSVTITHPLNDRTKVNSTEIGNWFLGILRLRLRFVPENLVVKWFITRSKSRLENRPPFNKNFLNGAHILTDSGVFYVLKLSDPNNQTRVINERNILEAAGESAVIEEVVYLKILSDMLLKSPVIKPRMDKVLKAAVKEITRLQKRLSLKERVKGCLEEEKLRLFNSYLMTIHLKGLNKKLSVVLLKRIEKLFFNKNGKINETYMKKLQLYDFGRLYLKCVGSQKQLGKLAAYKSNGFFGIC